MLSKNAGEIISEIKLLGVPQDKCYLLVEGDFDYQFWVTKIIPSDVELVNCSGKETVIKAIQINSEKNFVVMLGLLDQDYAYLLKNNIPYCDIIYTDYNDLETTCFSFEIYKDILQGNCNSMELKNEFPSLEDYMSILSPALFMGKLRYLSHKKNWHIPFEKHFPIGKYFQNSIFNEHQLLKDISNLLHVDTSEIEAEMMLIPEEPFWYIVQGHDCCKTIYNIVQKYKLSNLGNVNLTSLILTLFSPALLCKTEMYQEIKHWEATRQRYILSI